MFAYLAEYIVEKAWKQRAKKLIFYQVGHVEIAEAEKAP